ncbi:PREDICTED: uncharacterized protein LOC109581376 [Amphimedon queenslandica]|uniref:EF-hand domain-containing protein n=1 Tax=Amphimedon queenslandica TaxID=400682 RepID=A0AAN0J2P9_AMPQE|nr:PREDICTED: uncharacterized protein LOC109581376 [Amphimedon queenslandica]|eukprot:XP_019851001.1 PREDICTED: uncharacterized protein LOC109581376 [Amphimedon queenslandica]
MATGIGVFTKKAVAAYDKWILSSKSSETSRISFIKEEEEGDEEESEKYVQAFSDLGLQISAHQVRQLLLTCSSCIREEGERPSKRRKEENKPILSFHQFCVFASEVAYHHSSCRLSRSDDGSMEKRYIKPIKEKLKFINSECRHEVFLGGSCNPTVWRRELSIPLLENEGVTYYNPQVDHWTPELMEIEEEAKKNAVGLLFVIDNQTRACSSIVETAYLIGRQEEAIVVVVNDFLDDSCQIAGEAIGEFEFPDLKKSRLIIKDLIYSHNILIEPNVKRGTETVVKVVRELFTEEDLMRKLERNRITNKIYNENIISKLNYIFSMYDNYKDKTLTINEACLALHSLKVLSPFASLPSLLPSLPFSRWERDGINFDEFCMLYCELRYHSSVKLRDTVSNGWTWSLGTYLRSSVQWLSGLIWRPFPSPPPPSNVYDVYLGGTVDNDDWRKNIAIPLLM